MCFVGAGVAGATAINAMMATSIASAALSAYGMYQQGQNAQKEANYRAQLAERDAQVAEMEGRDAQYRGRLDRQNIALDASELIEEGKAKYAAGNVALGSGSAKDWQIDVAERKAGDDRMSQYNADVNEWGAKNRAGNARAQAGLYRLQGANRASEGMLGAGGSLLKGAATVGGQYYKAKYT